MTIKINRHGRAFFNGGVDGRKSGKGARERILQSGFSECESRVGDLKPAGDSCPKIGFNLIIYSPTNMVCLCLPTYTRATAGCCQRPTALPITANSCINLSNRSGVRDWGPSDKALAGLG